MNVNPAAAQTNFWTCFRKKFTLSEKPAAAIARIAVDSKYWLWINGKLAVYEGGLKRGPNPRDTRGPLSILARRRKHHRRARLVLG